MNKVLWAVQWVLAILFVFTGGMKLVMPIEQMTQQIALPGAFLRFIGVAEVLGGLGLILPGLLGIATWLTPLAAAGLTIIMAGATVVTLKTGGLPMAMLPMCTGLLLVFVIYGRWFRFRSRP